MLLNLIDVKICTQAGPLGDIDIAVHHHNRVRYYLLLPEFVEFIEDLVNEEVRDGRIQLHAGR